MANTPDSGAFRIADSIAVGGGAPLFLIAGPCVIESRDHTLRIAAQVRAITDRVGIPTIFKASYDKANRTSVSSFRGPGMDEGLAILAAVRDATGLPILSDVHSPAEASAAGDVLDVLQIPAFLCRQTDLIVAAAQTGKPLSVKKGQFLSAEETKPVVEKARSAGANGLMLTERGTMFGYGDLVVDFRNLPRMRAHGVPVIFDGTHSVQRPGGLGDRSGGDRAMIPSLVRAAVAVGCDGLFLETHDDPPNAKCDAATQWPIDQLEALLQEAVSLA